MGWYRVLLRGSKSQTLGITNQLMISLEKHCSDPESSNLRVVNQLRNPESQKLSPEL